MRVAGVREFRDHAPEFVGGKEIVLVTRHGRLAGMLVPLEKPESLSVDLRDELLERIGGAISSHLESSGISEEKALHDFRAWRKSRRKGRGGR